MPTISIIGGGTGGNLLAARLLEGSEDGQRLHVMLIEALGRAGPRLREVVKEAERVARGAFLTRLRGEATTVLSAPSDRVRVVMRSGRVLDVDRAVVLTGSVAARSLDALEVAGVHTLPSEGDPGELHLAVDALASVLIDGVRVRPTVVSSGR
jgi:hypothetical protein